MRLFALELASWSSVHISSCAVNKPLRLRYERAQRGDERVCVLVCLSLREHISGTSCPIFTTFSCSLPVTVTVARSSSGGVAIRSLLPVL